MDNLTKLFRVRKTCCEMLKDRGFLVAAEDLNHDKESFRQRFGDDPARDDLTLFMPQLDDPTKQIFVFFPEEGAAQKLGMKTVKQIIQKLRDENVHHAIVVLGQPLTAFAKSAFQEFSSKYHVECFQEAELLVNITKHVFVPKHEVLSPEDKAVLCGRYKVKDTQLPRIQVHDPIARYYGMQRGQVVRIVRPSETAGRYVTYRFCV